jgi:hypothetical protein
MKIEKDDYLIQNWICSCCLNNITYQEKDETKLGWNENVYAHTHFDLSRSNKDLEVNSASGDICVNDESEKMNRIICKKCFINILNESKTLGKLFLNKEKNGFVY